MRKPYRLPEAVILVLLVLLGWLLVAYLLRSKSRLGVPTRTNFDRVEVGMTAKEVAAILGPDCDPRMLPLDPLGSYSRRPCERWWKGDEAYIHIVFTLDDQPAEEWGVASKEYTALPPEPFLERLGRWREKVFGPGEEVWWTDDEGECQAGAGGDDAGRGRGHPRATRLRARQAR